MNTVYPFNVSFLNACYSIRQGDLISFGVPFTIAMEGSINDKAAIEFSRGFYDALGAGKPIDHAYREGCRRIKFALPQIPRLPFLLGQGETFTPENMEKEREVSRATIERIYFKEGKALVGFAIDLSGSIVESIRNEAGGHLSRLESVRQSIGELIKEAWESIRESRARHIRTSIDMFIYGFGLRTMPVCDLLSLVRASRQVITKDVAEEITQRLKQEKQEKYKGYEGTGDLVRQLGLSGAVSYFEDFTKRHIQALVQKRIWHEVKAPVEEQLTRIGDTTLPIEEVVQLWEDRRKVLIVISDGEFAEESSVMVSVNLLKRRGVTIITCLVADRNIISRLVKRSKESWPMGAKLMVEIASEAPQQDDVGTNSEREHVIPTLTDKKLCYQINHSRILEDVLDYIFDSYCNPEIG